VSAKGLEVLSLEGVEPKTAIQEIQALERDVQVKREVIGT
jgi:hypothetical protein